MAKYQFKTEPYQHQKNVLLASFKKINYALFLEMGTGKSKIIIDNIGVLNFIGQLNAALIIAPAGVYMEWVNKQIPTHLPDYIPLELAYWKSSANLSEQKAVQKICFKPPANFKGLKILVMNIDAINTDRAYKVAETFLKNHTAMLVVDESTTIKNHKAKRTKALIHLGYAAKFRRIATGSPILNSPEDLYSQCEFLDVNLLGHKNFYSYRNTYCVMRNINLGSRTIHRSVAPKNLGRLKERLSSFSSRITKKDCLDLPDKVYMQREVQMTEEQKHHYKAIKERAWTMIESGDLLSTQSKLTQLLRLHQISCGILRDDTGKGHALPHHRITELLNVIEETSGKMIIWANYKNNILEIIKNLEKLYGKESVVSYWGGVCSKDRETAIRVFQEQSSPVRFFVGTQAAGGYGITLTAANTTVYYSNNYDLEKRLQSEDRNHRIGQQSKVTYIDLVCHGTVDEKILKALKNKIDIAQVILGDDPREWLI